MHTIKIIYKNINILDKIVVRKTPFYHHALMKTSYKGAYICTFGKLLYYWRKGEVSFIDVSNHFNLPVLFIENIIMIYLHERHQKEYEDSPTSFGHRLSDLISSDDLTVGDYFEH